MDPHPIGEAGLGSESIAQPSLDRGDGHPFDLYGFEGGGDVAGRTTDPTAEVEDAVPRLDPRLPGHPHRRARGRLTTVGRKWQPRLECVVAKPQEERRPVVVEGGCVDSP